MTDKSNPNPDNGRTRKLYYTALRLKKFGKKLLMDITPPVITRLFTGKTSKGKLNADPSIDKVLTTRDMAPAEFAYLNGTHKVELPISRLRYSGGLRFTSDQHHFVRYLSKGISALEEFYEKHQPRDILEKHFVSTENKRELPLKGLPWLLFSNGTFDRNVASEKGLAASHGHQHHGPVSQQKILLEASHLDRLLSSFKNKGYVETDDYPTGHFLIDDNGDWAFYIKDGQHRISVMAHLGYETTTVRLTGNTLAAVSSIAVADWPMVRRGILSEDEALGVLRAYTAPDRKLDLFKD